MASSDSYLVVLWIRPNKMDVRATHHVSKPHSVRIGKVRVETALSEDAVVQPLIGLACCILHCELFQWETLVTLLQVLARTRWEHTVMAPHDDPDQNGQPSERSPLIPKDGTGSLQSGPALVPSNAGNGFTSPNKSIENTAEVDGEALERQRSIEDRNEGIPEVKKKMKFILPALAIGIFLSAADQTIIVSSYGKIGSELHALNLTSWIATSYFLTLTSFQPLFGKL